jgi:hypothetical protein
MMAALLLLPRSFFLSIPRFFLLFFSVFSLPFRLASLLAGFGRFGRLASL